MMMLSSFFSVFQNLKLFTIFWLIRHDIVEIFDSINMNLSKSKYTFLYLWEWFCCCCSSNNFFDVVIMLKMIWCCFIYNTLSQILMYCIMFFRCEHVKRLTNYSYFWAYLIFLIFYFNLKLLFSVKKMILCLF